MPLRETDSRRSSRSASAVTGNSKTMKSVRWSHEQVYAMPSGDATVAHPAVDHAPTPALSSLPAPASSHHLHSMAVWHSKGAAEAAGAPMHGAGRAAVEAPPPPPALAEDDDANGMEM